MLKIKKRSINKEERTDIFVKNIIYNFLLKGLAFVVGLLMVRVTYDFFDSSVLFGIWSTILTILSWITMVDLGLGNGLRNELILILAKKEYTRGKILVSTAYSLIFIIIIFALILYLLFSKFIDWSRIFNLQNNDLPMTMLVVITLSLISLFFNLIFSISNAYQKNYIFGFYNLIANICILIIAFILKDYLESNHLIIFATLYGLANIFVGVIASVILFSKEFIDVKPNIKHVHFKEGRKILYDGIGFFGLQLLTIIVFSFNNLIIIRYLGAEEVTEFQLAFRLFNIIIAISAILYSPLWSAYRDAYVRKDYIWMKRTVFKTKISMLVFIIITILFVLFGNDILRIWIGDNIKINVDILLLTGVYSLLVIWQSVNAYLLNSLSMLKVQMLSFTIGILIGIPLSIILGVKFGTSGVLIGSIVSLSFFSIIAPIVIRKKIDMYINSYSN